MKKNKKILIGLSVLIGVASLLFFSPAKAFADAVGLLDATYTKVSDKEIEVTLADGGVIKFWDRDTGDKIQNWKPTAASAREAGVDFCVSTEYIPKGDSRDGYDPGKGITFHPDTKTYTIDVDFDSGEGCPPPIKEGINNYTADLGSLQDDGQICSEKISCTPPGTGQDESSSSSSCEGNNNSTFEWMLCGVLRTIDTLVQKMVKLVESLLDFDTDKYLNDSVRTSWGIFKNIATVLLVIVMLLMVVSQAASIGPVDAYTLRKLLPKLVAAVILMQISWNLMVWVITLANHAGHAVGDLMAAPFGGTDSLQLDNLLGQVGGAGVTLTQVSLFATIAGVVAFSGLTIFGWFLLAASVALAIFVGFFLLLLREILIILAVILVPIALVLWILPGTQSYWKLWKDNFIRLLILFPLIMALLTGGRIFAQVAATPGNNAILSILAVLIGYFAPFFLLPKAFNWGGQLFGLMSNAAIRGSGRFRNYPGRYGLEKAKENREFKGIERARRIGRDPLAASRFDRLMAGGYNFARSRGNLRRQYARTTAEGQQAGREAVGQELMMGGYQNWSHPQKLDALGSWLRGESYGGINAEGNDELRLFAFKSLADLGDQDIVRRARQQGKLKGSVWLKGRAENISSLNTQASDMGIQNNLSEVAPDAMANWKSHTFKEWIRQVQQGTVMDNSDEGGGDIVLRGQSREKQLANAQSQAQRLMNNRLVFDRLSLDQQEFVRRMATREYTQASVSDAGVQLPTSENVANRPSVRQNMMQNLSEGGQRGQLVAAEFAPRVIEAARVVAAGQPLTSEQQGDLELFNQVRDRGNAPDKTRQMETALNNLQQAVDSSLKQHEAEAERRLASTNSPHTAALLENERDNSAAVKAQLDI